MKDNLTISLFELSSIVPTDKKAFVFLEELRWHGKRICPFCGGSHKQHIEERMKSLIANCFKCTTTYQELLA